MLKEERKRGRRAGCQVVREQRERRRGPDRGDARKEGQKQGTRKETRQGSAEGRAENSREQGKGRAAEGGQEGKGRAPGLRGEAGSAAWTWKKPGRTLTYFFLGRCVCCQSYCGDSPEPQ